MDVLLSLLIFVALAMAMVLGALVVGRFVRPSLPHPQKGATYECGEKLLGPNWVQFDLRFYIVALFYLVFDVEVALMYPWAVIFREAPREAVVLGLPFVGLVVIGYIYEWHAGSLDWVRSVIASSIRGPAGADASRLARIDPEVLAEEGEPPPPPPPPDAPRPVAPIRP